MKRTKPSLKHSVLLFTIATIVVLWFFMMSVTYIKLKENAEGEIVRTGTVLTGDLASASIDNLSAYDYYWLRTGFKNFKEVRELYYASVYDDRGILVAYYPQGNASIYNEMAKYTTIKDAQDHLLINLTEDGLRLFERNVRSEQDGRLIGKVVIAISEEIALAPFKSTLFWIVSFGLLLLVIILVILPRYLSSFTNPIEQIANACRAYPDKSIGSLKAVERPYAELSILIDALEAMSIRISEQNKHIERHAKDVAIGQIAAAVAHDIRSPLSSLRAAGLLLMPHLRDNKEAADGLNLLQLSSTRLENIANDLLARHQGKEACTAAVFSIHEVLDELIGELRASPLGQGTEFMKQYHSTALYISGDKTGISRAIGNIMKNALEAMQGNPAGRSRQLIVSTQCHLEAQPKDLKMGSNTIIIKVTDTGPGIPADKIPLILQGGHTEGKEDGHGIGTKVVREMVDAHKGKLAIESEVGVGTTFVVTLPVAMPVEEEKTGFTVTIPYTASGWICVIDDDAGLREQWRITLTALGATVETFTCWEDFADHHPGLCAGFQNGTLNTTFIVDYHFNNSEIDGLESLKRLKELGYTNLILATAEYWKPAIKEAAQKLNVTLCPKPLPRVVVHTCHPEAQPKDLEVDSSVVSLPQNDKGGPSVLLIDDDAAARVTWKVMRERLGIATLHSFPNLEAMIQANIQPSHCDICVIDKNIEGSEYNGARMLAYLKQAGAKKVLLATGENEADIRKDPDYSAIDGILAEKIPTSPKTLFN